MGALRLLAGQRAWQHIAENGLQADDIKVVVGASGGPKWFILAHLDRFLGGEYFRQRRSPLQLLGSSSGAFRFACLAQQNAPAATQRFLEGYQKLTYPANASVSEITKISQQLLDAVFQQGSVAEILNHPTMRLNVIAARAKHLNTFEQKPLQLLGLGLTAAANLVNRRLIGGFFERTLFHHPKDPADFLNVNDLPCQRVVLNESNLKDAVMASGSIPMVMAGIKDIAGARPGIYRDGGITDYHFDLPFSKQGIVLYPHFAASAIPGWFDKGLKWRKPQPKNYNNVLMLAPSDDFIDALPLRKIPDRRDFTTMDDISRQRFWSQAIAESERLADEFAELTLHPDRLLAALEPIN